MIEDTWKGTDAWSEYISAMRLVIPWPDSDNKPLSPHEPSRWALLPGLCCQAAGGQLETTSEVSAAWMLLYTAAHTVDTIEDGDEDQQIKLLGGPGVAINTANGLFLTAFEILNSMRGQEFSDELVSEIIEDYLVTIHQMAGGQHLDLITQSINLDQWWQIAGAKSGAFFALACRSGAQLGTKNSTNVKAYGDYGYHLGLLVQIIDDLEDFNRLIEKKLKPGSQDLQKSLAVVYGKDVLPETDKQKLERIIQIPYLSAEEIDALINLLDECGTGLYLLAEVERQSQHALSLLASAHPAASAGDNLEKLIKDLSIP